MAQAGVSWSTVERSFEIATERLVIEDQTAVPGPTVEAQACLNEDAGQTLCVEPVQGRLPLAVESAVGADPQPGSVVVRQCHISQKRRFDAELLV